MAGAVLGMALVNRELVESAYRQIKLTTGKEPAEITESEWLEFKKEHPNTARYLEKALQV
ncbi:MAG: hypothetical protein M5R36_06895 [Deltaproteobacteria bacterium]|nr:hypothetical protein [Deltaproteobacteria bacterium]